jgi:hypothetical protein
MQVGLDVTTPTMIAEFSGRHKVRCHMGLWEYLGWAIF